MCLVPHTITKKINFIALIEFNLADPGQTGSLRAEKEIYKEKGQIKAYITIKKKSRLQLSEEEILLETGVKTPLLFPKKKTVEREDLKS
jgi:hypothetical protein